MQLFDMHTHLQLEDLCFAPGFYQLAVATSPEECEALMQLAQRHEGLYFASGIHPWRSEAQPLEDMLPYLERSAIIGEIGMDSLWCALDLEVQHRVFRAQLAIAAQQNKPIILHTKGCERAVLDEIQGFTAPILVHWYSCDAHLQGYIEKDCYFSIGPDLQKNPAVQALARCVPLARILLESDGAGALSWALGCPIKARDVPAFLETQLKRLAQIRRMPVAQMERILFDNALRFLGKE